MKQYAVILIANNGGNAFKNIVTTVQCVGSYKKAKRVYDELYAKYAEDFKVASDLGRSVSRDEGVLFEHRYAPGKYFLELHSVGY